MSRPRSVVVVLGALALVVTAALFVPRGDDERGALSPQSDQRYAARPSHTAGLGALTPGMRAEIDQVVREGRVLGRRVASLGTSDRFALLERSVPALVRCAEFEGQRYCLGAGWTEDSEAAVQRRTARAARLTAVRDGSGRGTGDLDLVDALTRSLALTPARRAAAERAELTMAARSVAKVWLIRHQIQGLPLPEGFLERHPEARAAAPNPGKFGSSTYTPSPTPTATPTPTPTPTATPLPTPTPSASPTYTASPTASPTATPTTDPEDKNYEDYPDTARVLDPTQVAEQERSYWCGPSTMQMIAWGWKQKDLGQAHWANELGTTSSGTDISDIVRVINKRTGWDRKEYAGPYVTLDIGRWKFDRWILLMMRHVVDYRSPVVLHPVLLKRYFPYLDDDASGHFQVGRGYNKRGAKPDLLGYFEPWNQARFDPSEPTIARVQWRNAYRSFRANQDHYLHNVGV